MKDIESEPLSVRYYILALRAFFLATRDMSVNPETVTSSNPTNTDGNGNKPLSYHEKRELEGIEGEIEAAEARLAALEEEIASPGFSVVRNSSRPAESWSVPSAKRRVSSAFCGSSGWAACARSRIWVLCASFRSPAAAFRSS